MTRRHLTTGITLVVLVVILCVMAVWGYRSVTAPVDAGGKPTGPASPTCNPTQQKVTRYLNRRDVIVSVYNAGKKSGRARDTLAMLERAGFKAGEVGNAPAGVSANGAAIYTSRSDDPAVTLVAKALGKGTPVVRSDHEFGPGVAVVIGDKFKRLDPKAPHRLLLPKPTVTCG